MFSCEVMVKISFAFLAGIFISFLTTSAYMALSLPSSNWFYKPPRFSECAVVSPSTASRAYTQRGKTVVYTISGIKSFKDWFLASLIMLNKKSKLNVSFLQVLKNSIVVLGMNIENKSNQSWKPQVCGRRKDYRGKGYSFLKQLPMILPLCMLRHERHWTIPHPYSWPGVWRKNKGKGQGAREKSQRHLHSLGLSQNIYVVSQESGLFY